MNTPWMGIYRSRVLPHLINVAMSTDENREIRSRVCANLAGTVVEIGFGSGLNVPYYPPEVHTVHAVEPLARSFAGFVIDPMTTYEHLKEPKAFGWTFEGRARPA